MERGEVTFEGDLLYFLSSLVIGVLFFQLNLACPFRERCRPFVVFGDKSRGRTNE